MEVRVAGDWVDLKSWLNGLPPPSSSRFDARRLGDQGYQRQFRWWSMNGKSFRLMDLPRELRNLLFVHFIGSTILPDEEWVDNEKRIATFGRGTTTPRNYHHYLSKDEGPPPIRAPITQILCLNRQSRAEALEVGWNYTTKRFDHKWTLGSFVELASTLGSDALRHIALHLTHGGYMRFFAIDVPGRERNGTTRATLTFYY